MMDIQSQNQIPTEAGISENRLPSLDGFRAICICMVLGDHCIELDNFPQYMRGSWFFVSDGGLGVRFFFAISGFIITWLLLLEASRKDIISLKGFWARRAVRILPAYGVFILFLMLLQWMTPWHLAPRGWLGALTFTVNYNSPGQWLPTHLWSLSVEEQFYLLWPLTFVLLKPWRCPRTALIFLSCVVASCVVAQWIGGNHPPSRLLGGYSFLRRSDSIAFGCMGAILLFHYRSYLISLFSRNKVWMLLVMIFVITFPKILEALRLCPPGHFAGSTAIQGVGLVLLLIWSQLEPRHAVFRGLQFKPVVLVGTWSYSIYLWQQVFSSKSAMFGLNHTPWWLTFPLWVIPAIAFGMASFYLIEQPVRLWFKKRKTPAVKAF